MAYESDERPRGIDAATLAKLLTQLPADCFLWVSRVGELSITTPTRRYAGYIDLGEEVIEWWGDKDWSVESGETIHPDGTREP